MSRDSVLARGRFVAELGMVDACTIRRRDLDAEVTDPVTAVRTRVYVSPDPYAGKCRVQQSLAQAEQHDVGEDYQLLLRLELQVPMAGSGGLEVNDEVTITASRHDPDLVGRTFLIRDLFHKSEATARRMQMTERTDS